MANRYKRKYNIAVIEETLEIAASFKATKRKVAIGKAHIHGQ